MRSWITPLLLAVASVLPQGSTAASPAAAYVWRDVGTTVDDSYLSRSPAVAIGKRQQPVLAYVRTTAQSDGRQVPNVFVERFDGTAWVPLGAALNVKRRMAGELPRIVVDSQDRPIVAWYESRTEEGGRYVVYVKRWNGTAWESLGDALNTDLRYNALSHSLALGPDQQPVVAFAESDPGGLAVRVRRWDGTQWQSVGGASDIGLGAETQVAVDTAGQIAVSYTQEVSFSLRQVFAKRWDGTQWSALGGSLNRDITRPSVSSSLVAAADGTLTIAWQEAVDNASKVYASRWNEGAAAWQPLGSSIDGGVAPRSTLIAKVALLKSGQPVVAWTDASTFQTYVSRWNGRAWLVLGDNPVIATSQRGYDLKVDGKGRPVLAHGQSRAIFDGDVKVQRFGP